MEDDSLEGCYSKSVSLNKQQCQVLLRLTLRKTGCFRARISYKDQPLSNGEFDIIVLNGEQLLDARVDLGALDWIGIGLCPHFSRKWDFSNSATQMLLLYFSKLSILVFGVVFFPIYVFKD